MSLIDDLHATLTGRERPEDIALKITTSGEFERVVLSRSARNVLKEVAKRGWRATSMSRDFEQAANTLTRQIDVAHDLFPGVEGPSDPGNPASVHGYLASLVKVLRIEGHHFLKDRANREGRRRLKDVPQGHRAYNKRFRLLSRMAEKLAKWERNVDRRELAQAAKSRLASKIRREDLTDAVSACLVAYLTARANVRSVFTAGKQDRAFDEVCDALFSALDAEKADWLAIAHVHPVPEVLVHLTEEEKGRFLAVWYGVMERAARYLAEEVAKGGIDLERMIVRRGNDSSTWNESAGAFNKARDGWIAVLHALGAEDLLDVLAPGKALRLMAADVAWLHRRVGDGLDPDTRVWNRLPKPWDVVQGNADCDRSMIEAACKEAGVEGRGWVEPRPKSVAAWRPTPELVHGVEVASPALASILKKHGFYGGSSKGAPQAVALGAGYAETVADGGQVAN